MESIDYTIIPFHLPYSNVNYKTGGMMIDCKDKSQDIHPLKLDSHNMNEILSMIRFLKWNFF